MIGGIDELPVWETIVSHFVTDRAPRDYGVDLCLSAPGRHGGDDENFGVVAAAIALWSGRSVCPSPLMRGRTGWVRARPERPRWRSAQGCPLEVR
jgi:hypothetical protein